MTIRPCCNFDEPGEGAMDNQYLESIRERAWAIYNADIKNLVEPELNGKYLVLNVETGHYEIDDRLVQADLRMLKKHQIPKGEMPPHFAFRIGHPATYDGRV